MEEAPLIIAGFIVYSAVMLLAVTFLPTWLFFVFFVGVNTAPSIIYYRKHKKKIEELKKSNRV